MLASRKLRQLRDEADAPKSHTSWHSGEFDLQWEWD
jgi:hypothetical protein